MHIGLFKKNKQKEYLKVKYIGSVILHFSVK